MSTKVYRLLRNNKEQGPFTVEELAEKKLKPYDLIWVDGRSAAWSYPGELPELKTYAPLPGEQILNQPIGKQQDANTISLSVQAAIAINENIIQPAIKQKPRYKVSAAWSKIQTITTPSYSNVMVEAQTASAQKDVSKKPENFHSKSLSWEEAWLDWEKEKTFVAPIFLAPVVEAAKVKTAKTPHIKTAVENYNTPALETKYAEPLDSLKDKYIANILQQKQKAKKSFSFGKTSEFVLPTVALLVIFSIGYWLLHTTHVAASAINSTPPKTIQSPVINHTDNNTGNLNAVANKTNEPVTNEKQNTVSINAPAIKNDQAEERKSIYVHTAKLVTPKQAVDLKQVNKFPATQIILPDTKPTGQKTIAQPSKQFDPSVINNVPRDNVYNDPSAANTGDLNAADNRPVRRRTNSNDITINQPAEKNQPAVTKKLNRKSSAGYVSVPEYIEMNNGSADLKIQNISDVNLDLVVVNVQYYDASSHFRKGETLYLHNLKAGKNVIVKTPKDLNSLYAVSKVSLVSSDANNVYVIGDN